MRRVHLSTVSSIVLPYTDHGGRHANFSLRLKTVVRPAKYHPKQIPTLLARLTHHATAHGIARIDASIAHIDAALSSKRARESSGLVVAIVGASCSGKTSLARRLQAQLKKDGRSVCIVSQDHFRTSASICDVDSRASWEGPERTVWRHMAAKVDEICPMHDVVLVEGYLLFDGSAALTKHFASDTTFYCESTIETCKARRTQFPTIETHGARGWPSNSEYVEKCVWPCHLRHDASVPAGVHRLPEAKSVDARSSAVRAILTQRLS